MYRRQLPPSGALWATSGHLAVRFSTAARQHSAPTALPVSMFGRGSAAQRPTKNRFGIFRLVTIISTVAATENPSVGGSIPPLATTPLQALRPVFGLAFCFSRVCIDTSEFCIGISGQYKFRWYAWPVPGTRLRQFNGKRLPVATVATTGVSSATSAKSTADMSTAATATKSTADMSTAAAKSANEMSAATKKWPAAKPAKVRVGVPVVRVIRGRIVHSGGVLATPVPTPYPMRWVCTDRLG